MRLEPCPFCGSVSESEQGFGVHIRAYTIQNAHGIERTVHRVVCPSCGAQAAEQTRANAAAFTWNRRPKEVLILIARALECAEHPYNGLKLLQEAAKLYREKYDARECS